MGNKHSDSSLFNAPKTPSKSNVKHITSSGNKLYSDEKQFHNIESFKLLEDVDPRPFYLSCPNCSNYTLDLGFDKNVECGHCFKFYDAELQAEFMRNDPLIKAEERRFLLKLDNNIQELTDVALSVEKESLIDQFFDPNYEIKYSIIIQKILLPYFKMKIRILKDGSTFKIGDINFKVVGLSPYKYGYISSGTYIRLNNYYTNQIELERVLLLSTKQLINFSLDDLIPEILGEEKEILSRLEVWKVKGYEFYIKNCEPSSGRLTKNTSIQIENREIQNILKAQVAVIKSNIHERNFEDEKNYQTFIHQQLFKPYFLSGLKRYVERGDILNVDGFEFCILQCQPDVGFITSDTQVYYKYHLSKEKCLEKIENSDMKFAIQLARRFEQEGLETNITQGLSSEEPEPIELLESNRIVFTTSNISNLFSRLINRSSDDRSFVRQAMRRRRSNNSISSLFQDIDNQQSNETQLFIYSLPELVIDETYLEYIETKKLNVENITKCMICFSDFELNETLKTLPCKCIMTWLKESLTCPICKFEITPEKSSDFMP